MTSAVKIDSCRAAQREEWERICTSCPYATFFHTPLFADIFVRADGGRTAHGAQMVHFSDGAAAIVPLVNKRFFGNLLRVSLSMPGTTFGGWVSADTLTEAHARELAAHLCEGGRNLVWRENPFDPQVGRIDLANCRDDFTQAIDLRDGFEAASARFDHAHRKAVRKALASGVSIVEASSFDEWESYFALYSASRTRWKEKGLLRSRGYDRALLRALYESPPGHRRLWIAHVNGTAAAGILCFYWNRHAVAWLGAGAAEYFACRPNNLLYEYVIQNAAQAGYHWFDCNPSGGFKGVEEFKAHLGAKKLRSRIVNQRSPLWRAADWARRILR